MCQQHACIYKAFGIKLHETSPLMTPPVPSKKLLPDVQNFLRVLRTGPSNLELESLSDGTIRMVKKSNAISVTYKENQAAIRLITENFSFSLLLSYSRFSGQHNPRPYLSNFNKNTKNVSGFVIKVNLLLSEK